MAHPRTARWAFSLVLLLVSTPAWADPKDDARRHFVAGLAAAQARDYETALDEFLQAQAAYPHPASLYNIARSYADLGDVPKAVEYFELYLAAAPEKAPEIEPVLAALRSRLAAPPAPVATAVAPAPAPAAPVAAAQAEEIARLRAIAAELEALSAALTERAAAPVPVAAAPVAAADPAAPAEPAAVPAATSALPEGGALLSDAYERVVVTASRYGQSPLDSPSTITVLTEDDIRLSGATSIPEVLRRVVGVDVMELSAAQPDVSIRGFNRELSNKVLVLVDGRSVYLDFLGTVFWGSLPIALEEIERIEVIRGPGSAVYGANAMTGVINIITRRPGEGRSVVRAQVGTTGFAQGTALVDGRNGATSYRFTTGLQQVGRWSAEVPVVEGGALVPFVEDQSMSLQAVRANGRVDRAFLDQGLASLSAGYGRGMSEFYALGALGDYVMDFTSGYARGDLAWGPAHLRAFYNTVSGPTGPWTEAAGARSLNTTFDSDTLDTELEANGELDTGAVHHRLNAGVGYRYKRIDWGYLVGEAPIDEHHVAGFAQEEASMGPVALVGALRLDRHPLVPLGETISPRGAAIVRVAKATSVRVTAGSAFRSPTFMESYLDLAQPTDADGIYVRTLGDTTLSPERILTGEIGLHDESTGFHMADAAVYVNRVTDLIYLTDVEGEVAFYNPDLDGFSAGSTGFTNLAPVYTAYGAELDARVFPLDGLDLYANLALEKVQEDDEGVVVQDRSTSGVKINGGAMYRTPFRVDLGAHVSWMSDQTWRLREYDDTGALVVAEEDVPAHAVVSGRVAARPFPKEGLEIAVAGWNLGALGGATFREHPKGQLVGARVWGEASWRF